jgi:hypothetical protein
MADRIGVQVQVFDEAVTLTVERRSQNLRTVY